MAALCLPACDECRLRRAGGTLLIGDPKFDISGSMTDRLGAYFNTAAFAQPPDFSFGNAGWLRSPGINNTNLPLTKEFIARRD